MAGAWRKTLTYLGLVEDEDYEEMEPGADEEMATPARAGGLRRLGRAESGMSQVPETAHHESIVRTIPQSRPGSGSSIHRAEPKRFNEARELGDRYKAGVPVIMNLQETEDQIARRLVDFASGLVFGLGGKIELVANRVYLLTPHDMEVSAEERERLREGGFYNQF
ncbi:MAG TPA: cell division protein SepF [Actinomycetota bacterium]|jgi:cell division inhibitor SepF|nr:cell division protein SepF [Actinomycetota bacterium]